MEKIDNSPNHDTSAFKKVLPTVIFGIAALFHLFLLALQLTDLPYDRDEGFYLLACRLVAEGKALYSDFFYPQMPLFPSVYGAILKHLGYTIEAGRFVSLVFYEILCICVGLYVWRRTGRKLMGAAAWGLMAFNTLAIFWFSRVKTFAMCDLLIFISFVFLASHVSARETSARRKSIYFFYSFLAGLLLAFAFNSRLTSLPLFVLDVAFLAWIYRKTPVRAMGQAGAYMGGILTGSLPGIIAILRDWDAFWYPNVDITR